MSSNTEQQTDVNTKGSDVCTCLTWDSEDTKSFFSIKLQQLWLMNGSDSELSFDSWDFWGLLEQTASQSTQNLLETDFVINGAVESDNTDILFTGWLLGFDKTSGSEIIN